MWPDRRLRRIVFAVAAFALGAYDAWSVFVRETPAVTIQGFHLAPAADFGRGARITQAFRMTAGGLSAMEVQFSTDRPLTLFVRCEVTETDDVGAHGRLISDQLLTFRNVSGVEWRRIRFASVDVSDKRWYFLRLHLIDALVPDEAGRRAGQPPADWRSHAAVIVSRDNVFGGGALWIDDNRQLGSLSIKAFSHRRTAYERFRADIAPSLPRPLQSAVVEIAIALVYQASALVVVYALLVGVTSRPISAAAGATG